MYFVYMLLCEDGSLYTGVSNNVNKRFLDHKNGKGGRYTRSHKVIKVVYSEELSSKVEALRREAEIKKWKKDMKISKLKLDY